MLVTCAAASAQIGISVAFGPPALPVYEQPVCPQEGFLWTPGYWAYDNDFADYYWVPGTWVEAPEVGYLWTPGWWGYGGGGYLFHTGYWGSQVGFYGGISYGFGYFGNGFEGGRWDGGHFFYNRSVNNVNVTIIHNTYNTTVIHNTTINRVSFNGGAGGINARATPQEEAAANGRHIPPVAAQEQHVQLARANPQLRASANQGRPPIAATSRPTEFSGHGAVAANEAGAPYHAPANRGGSMANPAAAAHASELQPHQAPAPVSTGNAKQDQKFQQQQDKLIAKQNQQHQQLQMKQDNQHQQAMQRNPNAPMNPQMEQQHQQQTQQMEQRHTQQQQNFQQKEASHSEGRPR